MLNANPSTDAVFSFAEAVPVLALFSPSSSLLSSYIAISSRREDDTVSNAGANFRLHYRHFERLEWRQKSAAAPGEASCALQNEKAIHNDTIDGDGESRAGGGKAHESENTASFGGFTCGIGVAAARPAAEGISNAKNVRDCDDSWRSESAWSSLTVGTFPE